jgi:hypothetical protein
MRCNREDFWPTQSADKVRAEVKVRNLKLQEFIDKDQKLDHRRLALQLDDKEYFKFKDAHAWKTMEWCQNRAKASGFPENEYLRHSNRALLPKLATYEGKIAAEKFSGIEK